MKKIADMLLLSPLLMVVIGGVTACDAKRSYATEVIVRTAENFHSHEDVVSFLTAAARNNIRASALGCHRHIVGPS